MVTIEEIARLAGVSIGTVDRVLHDRGRVSNQTRDKILSIVESTGYKPNVIARSLCLTNKNKLGILLPTLNDDSGLWALAETGIEKAANELSNLAVETYYEYFDSQNIESLYSAYSSLLSKEVKGLILSLGNNQSFAPLISSFTIPYIYIGSRIDETAPLTIITQNHRQSGVVGARMLSLLCPNGTRFVSICTTEEFENEIIRKRLEGVVGFFSKRNHNADVSHMLIQDYSKIDIEALFDVDGIIILSSKMYSLVDNLEDLEKRPIIVGYNPVPKNRIAVKKGLADCIISQRIEEQGYYAMRNLCRKIVLSQNVEKEIIIYPEILLPENMFQNHETRKTTQYPESLSSPIFSSHTSSTHSEVLTKAVLKTSGSKSQ